MGGASAPAPSVPAPAPIVTSEAAPASLAVVGNVVLANYRQLGFYYVGVVTYVTGDQVSVLYADGDSELLPSSALLPDRLGPVMPGEVFREGAYVPVTIERRVGHALGLAFPDGTRQWTSIALVRVHADALPAVAPPLPPAAVFGEPGSIVLARYTGDGYWYEGVVGELVGDLRRVVYADGTSEDLPITALRPGGIAVGARVESHAHGASAIEAGTVLRRVEHGVEVQLDSGAPRWSGLGDVRVAP